MKLVTIIVPIYNVEQYLRECLDSIISQTYKNIEIILVDDGSPDRSSAICDEYAAKDARIKVIHKINGGLSSARNAGLEIAKGDYITFCDSDDILMPDAIECYIDMQSKFCCDIVSCESLFLENGKTSEIEHYHKKEPITLFSGVEYIGGFFDYSTDCSVCNKMYNREAIGKNRFPVGKTNEDILFQYDVLKNCRLLAHSNKGLYLYRVNESSITHSFNSNSLNTYYNAVNLHNQVKTDFPFLEEKVFCYRINNAYNLLARINNDKLNEEEPFSSFYFNARKYLISECIRILTLSVIPFKLKARYLYMAMGQPGIKYLRKII